MIHRGSGSRSAHHVTAAQPTAAPERSPTHRALSCYTIHQSMNPTGSMFKLFPAKLHLLHPPVGVSTTPLCPLSCSALLKVTADQPEIHHCNVQ